MERVRYSFGSAFYEFFTKSLSRSISFTSLFSEHSSSDSWGLKDFVYLLHICRILYLNLFKGTWSSDQQEYANQMLALWIGGSYVPVTLPKDQGFIRFMKAVNPNVSL